MTRKVKTLIHLEQLEPRIMLSGDSLLNIAPNPHQDTILDNTSLTDQYAELLDTHEQVEEQISLELTQPDTTNADVCQPILTLLPDDDNTNNEPVNADLSISNIINDADLSNEYATSIEIRGPPANETFNSEITASYLNNSEAELSIEYASNPDLGQVAVDQSTSSSSALELFGVSPSLFVENQGQWADSTVRYVHDGASMDVAVTDSGVLFQATRQDPNQGEDLSGPV
ncbi:MAG: LEPR-XLL domain-containing protein, partial [Planctomycetota bacterium]